MRFLFVLGGIVIGYIIYLFDKRRRENKEAAKAELLDFVSQFMPAIRDAVTRFFPHSRNFDAGYFTNYELNTWKNSVFEICERIKGKSYDSIGLHSGYVDEIKLLLDYYNNGAWHRTEYNKAFISHEVEKYSAFFDQVEGRKLDIQQRIAIVTDEDNNLVIAGAGSGKTTTIVGKVGYIIDRYKVPTDQILLISFTNKSASALAERINIPGVEAKTFHKFGKDLITAVEHRQPGIFDEKQLSKLIREFFTELIRDPDYLRKVTTYFTSFSKIVKSQDEFSSHGQYIQYMKDQDFSTYKTKSIHYGSRVTLKREVVKSIEECNIANFLLFNGLDYEYEYPYPYETATQSYRQYKPDFTIKQGEHTVYLEHYGLNKYGQVPAFFADQDQTVEQASIRYNDGIKWKKELHQRCGTTLVETYSHEMFDEVLFDNLSKNLTRAGIQLKPKDPEEIWQLISEAAPEEVENIITLFQTFLALLKSNNYSLEDVRNKNRHLKNKFHRQRNDLFVEIISPIYDRYQDYLAKRKEIDFSDMINLATDYVSAGKYSKKIRYVIIDEFQDLSIGRYELVKAIKKANPGCRLFCVGDDWQSIYRFSGSDISLFRDFEKYFGCTEKMRIERTYRFFQPMIGLSSDFILRNPNQTRKELKAITKTRTTTHKIVYSVSDNQDDTQALHGIFTELISSGKVEGKEILILGRYTFDIKRIKNEENAFAINRSNGTITYTHGGTGSELRQLSARFMTIHKSKGLEADIIIVINCNAGKHGFPSEYSDDPVLNLLLSDADQFQNGEERRLFYVAMTRAREKVYFVADSSYKSKFIAELEGESESKKVKKCPRCKTGELVKKSGRKNGKEWAFDGCSNFMYGCEFKKWL